MRKTKIRDADLMMEGVAEDLEEIGAADYPVPQAEIDRLETLYVKLYETKDGHALFGSETQPFDALQPHVDGHHHQHHGHHHGHHDDESAHRTA